MEVQTISQQNLSPLLCLSVVLLVISLGKKLHPVPLCLLVKEMEWREGIKERRGEDYIYPPSSLDVQRFRIHSPWQDPLNFQQQQWSEEEKGKFNLFWALFQTETWSGTLLRTTVSALLLSPVKCGTWRSWKMICMVLKSSV